MNKLLLSIFSFLLALHCYAQGPTYTSLNENFDVSCASSNGFPVAWYQYAVSGSQSWVCAPGSGINNTPCMSINDYTTHHNADTVWLITPRLDLRTYDKVYLNFFDKYSRSGDTLDVYVTNQYDNGGYPLCDSCSWTEIEIPFSQDDTDWRMHQIDLTPYNAKPLYVAFKYTSSATEGSIWYIDSVFTTGIPAAVSSISKQELPLTVVGIPNSNSIDLEYTLPVAGTYTLNLFDITGRCVITQRFTDVAGVHRTNLKDVYLSPGMYIVRLGNDRFSGFAKAAVQ